MGGFGDIAEFLYDYLNLVWAGSPSTKHVL